MAITSERVITAFERIVRTVPGLDGVKVVVIDLDGTMGSLPGWEKNQTLWQYTHHPVILQKLIAHMQRRMGLKVVLVSRNGIFCGDTYAAAAQKATELFGFDHIAQCARQYSSAPKHNYIAIDPSKTLLLDDQDRECNLAAEHGGYAIRTHLLLKTLLQKQLQVYAPRQAKKKKKKQQRRRATLKRR